MVWLCFGTFFFFWVVVVFRLLLKARWRAVEVSCAIWIFQWCTFKLEGNIVGRKVCIKTSLSPPLVVSDPTIRPSFHVARSRAWVLCSQLNRQTLLVVWGVTLMVGLQKMSFLGWCRIASVQLLTGDKNAASENFSPSSSHCATESKMPTCPSLLLLLLCWQKYLLVLLFPNSYAFPPQWLIFAAINRAPTMCHLILTSSLQSRW